jgi:N-formylmaleamate deformylase
MDKSMKRREFLLSAAAAGVLGFVPGARAALPRFASNRLSVVVEGEGPDVVLIPGLTASRDVWKGLVAALPGYRYHLVQVAGFAGDPARGNASGAVVQPVAAEIARYIAESGLRAPAVIGHSMGGTIALMIAARKPALAGRVMVVDMLPSPAGLLGASAEAIRPLADSLRNIFTASPGGRRLLESVMGQFGGDEPGGPKSDSDVVARAAHELALMDLTPELPRITAPLRVVFATPPAGGTADPDRIISNYRAAYAPARTARLTVIAESGHMIMYDQPKRFAAVAKAFLLGR